MADAFGYMGSDVVLLVKNFANLEISWTGFFIKMVLIISVVGVLLTLFSVIYFKRKYRNSSAKHLNIKYA